jgi:hypothetical protein
MRVKLGLGDEEVELPRLSFRLAFFFFLFRLVERDPLGLLPVLPLVFFVSFPKDEHLHTHTTRVRRRNERKNERGESVWFAPRHAEKEKEGVRGVYGGERGCETDLSHHLLRLELGVLRVLGRRHSGERSSLLLLDDNGNLLVLPQPSRMAFDDGLVDLSNAISIHKLHVFGSRTKSRR